MSLLQLCHLAKAVVVRSLPDQGAGKSQIHSDSADILPEKAPEPMSHNSRQYFQSKLWINIPVRTMPNIAKQFRSAHSVPLVLNHLNPNRPRDLAIHFAQS